MLGHISFGTRDLDRAKTFYDALFPPIGWVCVWEGAPDGIGYGPPGGNDKIGIFARAGASPPGEGFHLAFNAPNRQAVDAAYAAGMAHGGTDAGPPGPRPHYGATYYAAFLLDPEGWKLEIVHQ